MVTTKKNGWILFWVTIAVLALGWLFLTYVPLRQDKHRQDSAVFITERNVWNTPLKRHVIFDSGAFIAGPVSETGKRHGQWIYSNDAVSHVERKWYWYGKEVSEGKWHKRNN